MGVGVLIHRYGGGEQAFGAQTRWLREAASILGQEADSREAPPFAVCDLESWLEGELKVSAEGKPRWHGLAWCWDGLRWVFRPSFVDVVYDRIFGLSALEKRNLEGLRQAWKKVGLGWANPKAWLAICHDKLWTHQYLSEAGFSVCPTKALGPLEPFQDSPPNTIKAYRKGVLKPRWGSKGEGMWLWEWHDQLLCLSACDGSTVCHWKEWAADAGFAHRWVAQPWLKALSPPTEEEGDQVSNLRDDQISEARIWLQRHAARVWSMTVAGKVGGAERRNLAHGGRYVELASWPWSQEVFIRIPEHPFGSRSWKEAELYVRGPGTNDSSWSRPSSSLLKQQMRPWLLPEAWPSACGRLISSMLSSCANGNRRWAVECAVDLLQSAQGWIVLEVNSKPGRALHLAEGSGAAQARQRLVSSPFRWLATLSSLR